MRLIGFITCLLFTTIGFCQDSLCVFKIEGSAFIKMQSELSQVKKGNFLNNIGEILLQDQSHVTAIDNAGRVYQLNESGAYKYSELLKNRIDNNKSNFTKEYFKIIWDELIHRNKEKTIIGGVFRGDVLMTFPKDSMQLASSKISFEWQQMDTTEMYYVFIRNVNTDIIIKIETNGSTLSFSKNNPMFNGGSAFEWAVTTDALTKIKNIPFFKFSLIERECMNS